MNELFKFLKEEKIKVTISSTCRMCGHPYFENGIEVKHSCLVVMNKKIKSLKQQLAEASEVINKIEATYLHGDGSRKMRDLAREYMSKYDKKN